MEPAGSAMARGGAGRRGLFGLALSALAAPALAQVTTLDLRPAALPPRPDDWTAAGHDRALLIRWGDRVGYDAPVWTPDRPTPEAAGAQFGWDARLAATFVPPVAADGVPRLVLAVTHPEVDPMMAWPGGADRPAVAAAMQGASVLNLERGAAGWRVVDGGFQNRRLDAATLCRLSGPGGDGAVQGVLRPVGGCATPWGTLLLAEGEPGPWLARLRGLDPRFARPAGFGWVVELDPLDPASVPAKRTAPGRIGAAAVAALLAPDGRAVLVMADGRPSGFLYRFVSEGPAAEPDTLDAGRLAVARVEGESLRWLDLPGEARADPEAAARRAGASAFDEPAALAADPRGRRLLLACRGGGRRMAGEVDALNPRPGPNPGHVVVLEAADPAAARWPARLLLAAGDAGERGRYGRDQPPGALPRHPAALAVDGRGRLWIGTDRAGQGTGQSTGPDAVFACDLDGPGRALVFPIYAAPGGAGVGGLAGTPGEDALLVALRPPGIGPGATWDRPATRWPEFRPGLPPRSAVLAVTRGAGAPVGG